jgi:ribosomal protein L29
LKNVPVWQPVKVKIEATTAEIKSEIKTEEERNFEEPAAVKKEVQCDALSPVLCFRTFDLRKMLGEGLTLLAREGTDLEVKKRAQGLSKSERLAQQRKNIDQVGTVQD